MQLTARKMGEGVSNNNNMGMLDIYAKLPLPSQKRKKPNQDLSRPIKKPLYKKFPPPPPKKET